MVDYQSDTGNEEFRLFNSYMFSVDQDANFHLVTEEVATSAVSGQIAFKILRSNQDEKVIDLYSVKIAGAGFNYDGESTGTLSLMGTMGFGSITRNEDGWNLDLSAKIKFTHRLLHRSQKPRYVEEHHSVYVIPDICTGGVQAQISQLDEEVLGISGRLVCDYESGEWAQVSTIVLEFESRPLRRILLDFYDNAGGGNHG